MAVDAPIPMTSGPTCTRSPNLYLDRPLCARARLFPLQGNLRNDKQESDIFPAGSILDDNYIQRSP